MRFTAFDAAGGTLRERIYYLVGGGFVVNADALGKDHVVPDTTMLRYPFRSGGELLARGGLAVKVIEC